MRRTDDTEWRMRVAVVVMRRAMICVVCAAAVDSNDWRSFDEMINKLARV